jgi:hypothetical protein
MPPNDVATAKLGRRKGVKMALQQITLETNHV